MRRIRDVLRLTFVSNMSQRQIQQVLKISRNAIADYLCRAQNAGLSWPLPEDLDDAELEQLLFTPVLLPKVKRKPVPEWLEIHQWLKVKGATLELLHLEYKKKYPDGMCYSNFCTQHREFEKTLKRSLRQVHIAGEKVFVDYAGPTVPIHNIRTDICRCIRRIKLHICRSGLEPASRELDCFACAYV